MEKKIKFVNIQTFADRLLTVEVGMEQWRSEGGAGGAMAPGRKPWRGRRPSL